MGLYAFIIFIIGYVWETIVPFGWYLVGLAIVFYHLQKKYHSWKLKQLKSSEEKKDPVKEMDRLLAARERIQQKYQEDAELAEELALKMKEKFQERKREKWLKTQTVGNRLGRGEASGTFDSKVIDGGYLPLMGGSTSRGYRPQNQSSCGKGRCG